MAERLIVIPLNSAALNCEMGDGQKFGVGNPGSTAGLQGNFHAI